MKHRSKNPYEQGRELEGLSKLDQAKSLIVAIAIVAAICGLINIFKTDRKGDKQKISNS